MAQQQQQPKKFAPPVSVDEMFPTEHIKCADLRGEPRTFTITTVAKQEVDGEKGIKVRGVVKFKETDQSLVMNRTNASLLMAMFGPNPQAWLGKRVTLKPDETKFGPDTVPCIRIGGSPDIERDIRAPVKLPRKKNPVVYTLLRTLQSAPTIADYESCKEQVQFEGLEARRKQFWGKVPSPQKPPLKEAAEACGKRMVAEQQEREQREAAEAAAATAAAQAGLDAALTDESEEGAEIEPDGDSPPLDLAKALQDLQKPADRDALDATWSLVVDYFDRLGQDVPATHRAAYQLSQEDFAK